MGNIETKIEPNETLSEYNGAINNYLKSTDITEGNIIKNEIIQKAISQLNPTDLFQLKAELTKMALQETGARKMKLYELNAGLYNHSANIGNTQISETSPQTNEGFFEIPNFIIKGGQVKMEGKVIEVGSLGNGYMGDGKYQFHISDYLDEPTLSRLKLREGIIGEIPTALIIGKDEVYAKDSKGTYKLETVKIANNHINVQLPGFGIQITLNKTNI